MERCDVLIAGGGPAGAACAGALERAGLDVLVMDRASFPRDKVCAGWVTPQGFADLQLDLHEYRRGRTLQPFTAFRVGVIGGAGTVDVSYGRPVSYGIRRCEFDDYLLRRSGARLKLGAAIDRIRREGDAWIVNDEVGARMLVGAGGHFCPVARLLNGREEAAPLVVAQEAEFPVPSAAAGGFAMAPERPELYFSRDLDGYGWCIRKQDYVNVGFGCLNRRGLPAARDAFVAFLRARNAIPGESSWCWRGHAYLLGARASRRVVDDGAVLIGDAAGLAYPQSGEGIRPAIESGLLAASAIVQANGRYGRDRLAGYERRLRERFGSSAAPRLASAALPPWVAPLLGRRLLRSRRFVRHVVLDRWFLHAHEPALDNGPSPAIW